MVGGADGGMGTTLSLGEWMMSSIEAIAEPGGSQTTRASGGQGVMVLQPQLQHGWTRGSIARGNEVMRGPRWECW